MGSSVSLSDIRVTVLSSVTPRKAMAGPAIRALNLALQLHDFGYTVTLAAPDRLDIDIPIRTVPIGRMSAKKLRILVESADVVVTQPMRVDLARGLHASSARVIYDLYVPSFVEYPESLPPDSLSRRSRAKLIERNRLEYATAVNCGDGFLVASERQKDFIIGALGQSGRMRNMTPGNSRPTAVEVVPFGISPVRPKDTTYQPFKGSLVPSDSIVMLWTGGLWNWFDPATVLSALLAARQHEPRLRMIFLGAKNPYGSSTEQSRATSVFSDPDVQSLFNEGTALFASDWVDYDDRYSYLADADLGVSAYFDTLETRMSFRTRLLDHLWAGLPTVTTSGGVLAEEMEQTGAAVCVPPKSVSCWTAALIDLARDTAKRQSMSTAATDLANKYLWPVATEPLKKLVGDLAVSGEKSHAGPTISETMKYLTVAFENRVRRTD